MNRENVTRLRDHLNSLATNGEEERFSWPSWVRWVSGGGTRPARSATIADVRRGQAEGGCGTAACIAGWAVALMSSKRRPSDLFFQDGRDILGINNAEASKLFYPQMALDYGNLHPSWLGYTHDMPPRAAALVLDNLLTTGSVDWSVVGPRRCFDENGKEIIE